MEQFIIVSIGELQLLGSSRSIHLPPKMTEPMAISPESSQTLNSAFDTTRVGLVGEIYAPSADWGEKGNRSTIILPA
jgi:hypothetical protein